MIEGDETVVRSALAWVPAPMRFVPSEPEADPGYPGEEGSRDADVPDKAAEAAAEPGPEEIAEAA